MGDADDLIPDRELLKLAADHFGHASPDTGVDLVEDERGGGRARRGLEQRGGDGQLNARQLAAGGDALHRFRLLAAIGRHEDVEAIEAVGSIGSLLHGDAHGGPLHGQVIQLVLDRFFERARRLLSRLRQFLRRRSIGGRLSLLGSLQLAEVALVVAEPRVLFPDRCQMLHHSVDGTAVFLLQPLDGDEALLYFVEASRIVTHGVAQSGQLAGDVLQSIDDFLQLAR